MCRYMYSFKASIGALPSYLFIKPMKEQAGMLLHPHRFRHCSRSECNAFSKSCRIFHYLRTGKEENRNPTSYPARPLPWLRPSRFHTPAVQEIPNIIPQHDTKHEKHEAYQARHSHYPEERKWMFQPITAREIHAKVTRDKGQWREEDRNDRENHHEVVRLCAHGVEDES